MAVRNVIITFEKVDAIWQLIAVTPMDEKYYTVARWGSEVVALVAWLRNKFYSDRYSYKVVVQKSLQWLKAHRWGAISMTTNHFKKTPLNWRKSNDRS